jgi:hypothetical protein
VPVHVAKDLTPQQAKAYRLADNKTNELADWDYELLPIELKDLQADGYDLSLTSFSEEDLEKLLNPNAGGGLTDPDDVPEPPKKAITKSGDLWTMGKSRLMCGSALCPQDVSKLLRGMRKPICIITDPPFELDAMNQKQALGLSGAGGAVILGNGREFFKLVSDHDFRYRSDFVIFYDRMCVQRPPTTGPVVWNDRAATDVDDAMEVPVESGAILGTLKFDRKRYASINGNTSSIIRARCIKASGMYRYAKEHIIWRTFIRAIQAGSYYDPFAGSGTMLIAAMIEGVTCACMEMNPSVCDIALLRWKQFSGHSPERNSV